MTITSAAAPAAAYEREYAEVARLIEHIATASHRAEPLPAEDPRHGVDARELVAALELGEAVPPLPGAVDNLIGTFTRIISARPGARRPDREQAQTNLRWLYKRMTDFTTATLPAPAEHNHPGAVRP
ncbi:hypothetical protein HQQ81_21070 [Microbacteriaceae bacterium VKM Ac-2854]|nr:hypothetical protein [Microbacteriaceae bacterium VKM Ac-2854]